MSLNDNKSTVKIENTKRDLIVKHTSVSCAYGSYATATFSTAFPSACSFAVAYCGQSAFSSASNITVDKLTKSNCRVYQMSTAGVAMIVDVIAFGY